MEDNLIPVEGENYLYRDSTSNAIINTNQSGYESYISRKKFQENEKQRLDHLESEIGEIKSLLKALAERSI
jgi:histidinol phosphatase-like enzyme